MEKIQFTGKVNDLWGTELTLKTPSYYHQLLQSLKKDVEYSITIEEVGKKRTLQQNAFLWKLIHEIGLKMQGRAVDDEEIYCDALEQANTKTDYYWVPIGAEDRLRSVFRRIRYVDTDGEFNLYKVFYGSSKLNTKEMSELIEVVLDFAMNAGVDNLEYWREQLL